MRNVKIALGAVLGLLALPVLWIGLEWTVNRVYVPEGHSLMLRYKGPLVFGSRKAAKAGEFAKAGEIGVLEELRGPGRHFFSPIWWETRIVPDLIVGAKQVAVVTSRLGDDLPPGQFLVEGDLYGENRAKHKGVLRRVFGPGRYRVHPYAYEFKVIGAESIRVGDQDKMSGWVEIPTGYVGVVTNLVGNPAAGKQSGIQDDVLQPGLYPINPREQQVDVMEVGYWETSISVEKQFDARGNELLDESGEPIAKAKTGVGFPSNDGFQIQLDFSAIWGILPEQAPAVVRTFGNARAAEQKVILPQSESICRNSGSKLGAVELLVGESRQRFQDDVSESFKKVLEEKNLSLLYGLVRHIYIPQEIRVPIQNRYIADELKLTRDQETITAETEGRLREAERKVELETERVKAETQKKTANVVAEGKKEALEIEATTKQQVAAIDKQIAELDARKEILLGEAKSKAKQLEEEARAQKFQLAVEAFGSSSAYNKWQFAEGLPPAIDLRLFYAGEGTLWTDLKGVMPTLPLQAPAPASSKK